MVRLTQIPLLLFVGGWLYGVLGLFYMYSLEGEWPSYLGFWLVPALAFILTFLLHARKVPKEYASYCLTLCMQVALVHSYFFFPVGNRPFMHSVGSALLLVAVIDATPVMSLNARKLNAFGAGLSTLVAIATVPEFRSLTILWLLVLLLAWKYVVSLVYRRELSKRLKARQLEAFRATVVTLNHEFNNLAAISHAVLFKIRSNPSGVAEPEDLETLERTLKRLVALIKRFRQVEVYDEVTYLGEVKMVELPR